MRTNNTKLDKFVMLMIMFICLYNSAHGETSECGGRIIGQLSLSQESNLEVDMIIPKDFSDQLVQYKLAQVYFSAQKIEPLIDKFFVARGKGEKWDLYANGQYQGASLVYREENAVHGPMYISYSGTATSLDENDVKLKKANDNVLQFLDEIGMERYEYPFYAVKYDFQMEGSSQYPFSTQDDYFSTFTKLKGFMKETYRKRGVLGQPNIVVVIRFLIDDLPFALKNIYDSDQDGVSGDGNASPYAIFSLTNDGKIANVFINKYFVVDKTQPQNRRVIGWEEIVRSQHFSDRISILRQEGEMITLLEVEPVLGINKNGVTYPAWRFVFDGVYSMDKVLEGPTTRMIDLYFDAFSGNSV